MSVSAPSGTFFSVADLGLPVGQSQLLALWLTAMQAQYPGYTETAADPLYAHAQIVASWAAACAQLCTAGSTELFRQFGTQLLGLPYEQGTAAQAIVTITATDSAGYTLASGTQLTLTLNGATVGFQTAASLTISEGSTSGQVTVIAVQTGTAFNGAGSPVQMVSQIDWIASVTLVTSASGGVDQEDDDSYVQRLAQTLTLLAPRPITASDFATMALNFAPDSTTDQEEVGRATALDGYDPSNATFVVTTTNASPDLTVTTAPGTGLTAPAGATITGTGIPAGTIVESSTSTTITMSADATATATNISATVAGTLGNEREITVCVTASDGTALNSDTLTAVADYLEAMREVNFIVNAVSATYSTVYVTVTVQASAGYDAATVQSNVQAALLAYLTPANFGLPQGSLAGWSNTQAVYLSKVAAVIQSADGVDHVVAGTLAVGLAASPTNTTADLVLPGAFPMAQSSDTSIPTDAITVNT